MTINYIIFMYRFVPLAPWVKVYLVSGKKCLAKAKTSQENSPTTSTYISDYLKMLLEGSRWTTSLSARFNPRPPSR